MTRILIAHETDADRYFDASTPDALAAACLKLLTERRHDYYPEPVAVAGEGFELPSDEVLATLPEDVRRDLKSRAARQRRDEAEAAEYARWWKTMTEVVGVQSLALITLGRGGLEREEPLAYVLLRERSDYEYERIELVDLESVALPDVGAAGADTP